MAQPNLQTLSNAIGTTAHEPALIPNLPSLNVAGQLLEIQQTLQKIQQHLAEIRQEQAQMRQEQVQMRQEISRS